MLGLHLGYGGYFTPAPLAHAASNERPELVSDFLERTWRGQGPLAAVSDPLLQSKGICWVTGFRGGYPDIDTLSLWRPRDQALRSLLGDSRLREMEAVEVGVATDMLPYEHEVIPREEVGIWGLLLRCSTGDLCLVPSEFSRWGEFPDGQASRYTSERLVLKEVKFRALSFVLRRDQAYRPVLLTRGDIPVTLSDVSPPILLNALHNLAGFQQRMVEKGSGMPPWSFQVRTGEISDDQRRGVAGLAIGCLGLARYASFTGGERDRAVALRSLQTVIARYGHETERGAFIADGAVVDLDAQALMALAIRIQPKPSAALRRFEDGLAREIGERLQPDGHFEIRRPVPGSPDLPPSDPDKDQAQWIAPGIALDYLYARAGEVGWTAPAPPQNRVLLALRYYESRFDRHPDKTAVPWLADAIARSVAFERRVGSLSQRGAHQERVSDGARQAFVILDWNLNNLQPWEKMEPETRGAFVNPEAVRYGPICYAYEAGQQLQGLVAGWQLARRVGDKAHMARFETAIHESIRYLLQLQYRDRNALYWLPTALRSAPQGGVRDCLWDQTIRVDSCGSVLYSWSNWLQKDRQGEVSNGG